MAKLYAGGKIRALRSTHNLTQAELAQRLELSPSYINQLENDSRPLTVSALMAMSRAFSLPPEYFSPTGDTRTTTQLADALPGTDPADLARLTEDYPGIANKILERLHPSTPPLDPYEQVHDFFYRHRNYFPHLDSDAEALAAQLGDPPLRLTRLASQLDRELDISVRFTGQPTAPKRELLADAGVLIVRRDLREAQMCFELALTLALGTRAELIDATIAELEDPQVREIARLSMAQYYAAAMTMPYTGFRDRAEELDYDIEMLLRHYGGGFEATCQRLTNLQRPGRDGVPLFFVRTDRAGNISKRQSAPGFHIPRSSGSCPLWVLHRAFENPGRIVPQVAVTPDNVSYLWIARTVSEPSPGFGLPQREFAVGLGCELRQAHRLVYSQGLDVSGMSSTPIGPGCRACPRPLCPQRAFPQASKPVVVNLSASPAAPYMTSE